MQYLALYHSPLWSYYMLKFSSFQALTISGLNNVRMTNFAPSGRHHSRIKMYKIHFDWTSHCGVMHWNAMESSSQPWPSFPECPGSKCWLMEPEDGFSSQCGFGNQKVVSAAKEWTQQSRWPLCRGHPPPEHCHEGSILGFSSSCRFCWLLWI